MDTPFEFGGRVWIRLSDIPQENLIAAAEKLVDQEIKTKEPIQALNAARLLRQVALDPAQAAVEIPGECTNRAFSVSAEAYQKAMHVPKTRRRTEAA